MKGGKMKRKCIGDPKYGYVWSAQRYTGIGYKENSLYQSFISKFEMIIINGMRMWFDADKHPELNKNEDYSESIIAACGVLYDYLNTDLPQRLNTEDLIIEAIDFLDDLIPNYKAIKYEKPTSRIIIVKHLRNNLRAMYHHKKIINNCWDKRRYVVWEEKHPMKIPIDSIPTII